MQESRFVEVTDLVGIVRRGFVTGIKREGGRNIWLVTLVNADITYEATLYTD